MQAAGRLIRSPEDTGVIALFDQRFLHAPYRHHLPADWLPEDGAGALVGDAADLRIPADAISPDEEGWRHSPLLGRAFRLQRFHQPPFPWSYRLEHRASLNTP